MSISQYHAPKLITNPQVWHSACSDFVEYGKSEQELFGWTLIKVKSGPQNWHEVEYLVHEGYLIPSKQCTEFKSKNDMDWKAPNEEGTASQAIYTFYNEIHLCNVYQVPKLCFHVEDGFGRRCSLDEVRKILLQSHFMAELVLEEEHPINSFDTVMALQPCDTEELSSMFMDDSCRHAFCCLLKWWFAVSPLVCKPRKIEMHKKCYMPS